MFHFFNYLLALTGTEVNFHLLTHNVKSVGVSLVVMVWDAMYQSVEICTVFHLLE